MDYEKAYNKALEIAKKWYNAPNADKIPTYANRIIVEIFPELKESEDERIRKALITFFQRFPYDSIEQAGTNAKEAIAWLEKQGKNINVDSILEKIGVKPAYLDGNSWCILHGDNIQNGICGFGYTKEEALIEFLKDLLEKQDEKKVTTIDFNAKDWYVSKVDGKIHDVTYNAADKVGPKFKVGDWVVDNRTGVVHYIANIKGTVNGCYYVLGNDKGLLHIDNEEDYHLWTIDDAKDGDVLIDKSHVGECVFIFKEARPSDIKTDVNNPLAIIGYCGINHIGFTSQLSGLGFGDTVNCTYYPATKEQRDTLFKAMAKEGYEWDAEKKELKKIHVIDEGKAEMDHCFTKMMAGEKANPTWSEDDEEFYNDIIKYFSDLDYSLSNDEDDVINWLKSLKERLS